MAHEGVVKSYNPQKGWGFIECQETFDMYGKDIFLLRSALGPGGVVYSGDTVRFNTQQGDNGMHATDVQVQGRSNAQAPSGRGGGGGGAPANSVYSRLQSPPPAPMGSHRGGLPPPPMPMAMVQPSVEPTFVGRVKSYNEEKGFGFITNPAVTQIYGKDACVRRSSIRVHPIHVGEQVSFAVVEGDRGPNAEGVMPFIPAMPTHMPSMIPSFQMGTQRASSMGAGAATGSKAPSKNERYYGVVKTFNEEKGWGHIECALAKEHFNKDVFLLRNAFGDQEISAGSSIAFKVSSDARGPKAEDVTLLPPGCFGTAEKPGNVHRGTVKSFMEDKGWGFLTSDEIQQVFGKDIFFHKREFTNGLTTVSQGDSVEFTVEQDNSGKLQAKDVSPGDGGLASGLNAGQGGMPLPPPPAVRGNRSAPY